MRSFIFASLLLVIAVGFALAQGWTEIPGIATDIAVDADGNVWIVGSAQRGHLIFRWDDGAWVKAPGSKWRSIASGPKKAVYAINREDKVFRWKSNDWKELPGAATDLAVGADGSVFIIGSEAKGHRIYMWKDGSWSDYPGSNYKSIAVDPDGNPYVVSSDNTIHRWHDKAWQKIPGSATDVAIGADGSVFIIGTNSQDHKIYRWDDGAWTALPGSNFRQLSVGPDGKVWATKGDDGKIFKLR